MHSKLRINFHTFHRILKLLNDAVQLWIQLHTQCETTGTSCTKFDAWKQRDNKFYRIGPVEVDDILITDV